MIARESSSSLVVGEEEEPTMGDTTTNTNSNTNTARKPKKRPKDEDEEKCDEKAWDTLSKSFKPVQTVLDQNRQLIQQVNANHQSKIPDNLAENASLIRDINGNISKVMSIYSDLSVNFANIVHERRRNKNGESTTEESLVLNER